MQNWTSQIFEIIALYSEQFILLIMFLLLAALIVITVFTIKLHRLLKQYQNLMSGADGSNLEAILKTNKEDIKELKTKSEEIDRQLKVIQRQQRRSIQQVGVVRYNAFPDVGSDLSFSVALLNPKGDGVVLSAISGRAESRTYSKPIERKTSTYQLSQEEQQAIEKAMEQ